MSTRIVLLAVFLTLAAAGMPARPAAAQAPALSPDHDANVALVRTWTSRFLARDFEGLAAIYTEGAVLLPPNEPELSGRVRIRAWFGNAPSVASYEPTIAQVEVRGDLAVARGSYAMTFTPKGASAPVTDRGKWLEVRRKQPDGRWLIAVDIFNSSVPGK